MEDNQEVLAVARLLLGKVKSGLQDAQGKDISPQNAKQYSGVLKDLRDLLCREEDTAGQEIQVVFAGCSEELGK